MDKLANGASRKADETQLRYGANALFALGSGFGLAAVAMSSSSRMRNLNCALAAGCLLSAGIMRLQARGGDDPPVTDPPIETEPSADGVDYTIVIPVYNRPQHVAALLAEITAQSNSWSHLGRGEIIVVDDGSTDDTRSVIAELAKTVPVETRVISIPHRGPGAARNAGFAAGRGSVGISIDSDCLPQPDWFEGLFKAVKANKKAVAFALIGPSTKVAFPLENAPDRKGFVTASFAMDREAFCGLGGFHGRYGMSHEDLDFVKVAERAGFTVSRVTSSIYHPIRYETPRSIWRAGLNSKYANLFARRHGRFATGITRTTPYFFFGIAGNYGSSIAMLVAAVNVLAAAGFSLVARSYASQELPQVARVFSALGVAYIAAMCALGLRVGVGVKRLPRYVATLGSFQTATMVGRIAGSREYGLLLL